MAAGKNSNEISVQTTWFQFLIGLNDPKTGEVYSHETIRKILVSNQLDAASIIWDEESKNDKTLEFAPMISEPLLGIYKKTSEPSVILLIMDSHEHARYDDYLDKLRGVLTDIFGAKMHQEQVYWIPAFSLRSILNLPTFITEPIPLTDASQLYKYMPRRQDLFARTVSRSMAIVLGPIKDDEPTFLAYRSPEWQDGPYFLPNYSLHGQFPTQKKILGAAQQIAFHYSGLLGIDLTPELNDHWKSVEVKRSGDPWKRETFKVDYGAYYFHYVLYRSEQLNAAGLDDIFERPREHKEPFRCEFRTLTDLLSDPMTCRWNHDVIGVLESSFSHVLSKRRE